MEKGVVHTDNKANNILIDWKEKANEIVVEQVQLADIGDATYVPDNCEIQRRQLGN